MSFDAEMLLEYDDQHPSAHIVHAVGVDSGYPGNPSGNATFKFRRDEGQSKLSVCELE